MDNKVTHLGCEFIAKALTPGPKCPPIMKLMLDHNHFGSKGCNALMQGLKMNENIKELSLKFCSLDQDCARGIMEMLIFSKSKLEQLYLNGNNLRNEGTIKVLRGVSAAKELKKIHLADNQFNEDMEVLEAIKACMSANKTLAKYDF